MMMSAGRRLTIAVFIAAIAAGLVLVLARPSEPEHQGRTLSSWLRDFDHWNGDTSAPVALAMQAMGKKAVPRLVESCFVNDSAIKQTVAMELEKYPSLLDHRFTTAPEKWTRAQMALRVMGHDARAALPAFLAALTNASPFIRLRAVSAIGWVGPEAEDCLPILIARQDDRPVRGNLMAALELIGRRPELCVPILMKALEDADPIVRQNAVHALGSFHGDAKIAIPALTKAMADKATARRAADALKKIQPDERVIRQSF